MRFLRQGDLVFTPAELDATVAAAFGPERGRKAPSGTKCPLCGAWLVWHLGEAVWKPALEYRECDSAWILRK